MSLFTFLVFSFLSPPQSLSLSPLSSLHFPPRQDRLTPARLLVLGGPFVLDRDGVDALGQLLGLLVHVLIKRSLLMGLLLWKVACGVAAHGGSVSDVQERAGDV